MNQPDPEPTGWCAGRVYCFCCEHIAVYVWPWGADERRLQCVGCRQLDSLVVTRILTKEMTGNLLRALRNE
jgi:hypothetical protein